MQSQPIFCAANHTVNPSCWPPRGAKLFLFLFFRGVGEDFYERATWDMWKKKKMATLPWWWLKMETC